MKVGGGRQRGSAPRRRWAHIEVRRDAAASFVSPPLRISSFSIMRFLFLLFVVVPVLGTELHGHIRERRQQPNYQGYGQTPAAIKQILAAQQARDPIVHLPPQPVPNLSPSQPIEPKYVTQSQLSQYRPNIQVGQAPQQPTYKQIPVRPAQYNPPSNAPRQYNPQYQGSYSPQPVVPQAQPAQPNYPYSKNLPPQLQQLVQLQQNLPNAIPQGQHQG